MDEIEAKSFLCLTALCLSPTNRDAKLLRGLGCLLSVPDKSQAGALTLIPTNENNNNHHHHNGGGNTDDDGNANSNNSNMLERAEHFAADLRSSLTPTGALEGFAMFLLLFIQSPAVPTSSSESAATPDKKKKMTTSDRLKAPRSSFAAAAAAATTSSSDTSSNLIRFDARTSVILRRLALLLRIKLSTVSALEELALFNLEQRAMMDLQKKSSSTDEPDNQKKKWVRGLKIGAAATAAGGLLAVTGGLAAPALATGLASLGLGAVATMTTTATVATLLGAGGAGLGAYKMNRRTKGVQHFEFQPINDDADDDDDDNNNNNMSSSSSDEKLKGMTVYICVTGYLRAAGPDDGISDSGLGPETTEALMQQQQQSVPTNSLKASFQRVKSASFGKVSRNLSSELSSSSLPSSSSSSSSPTKARSSSSSSNRGKSAAHSPDFFAPWGAQPKHLFPEQILDRFYSVVAPEKRGLAAMLVQTYVGQEDALMDELARRYNGIHPKRLCPAGAKRDFFRDPQQKLYHELLQRAEERLKTLKDKNDNKAAATATKKKVNRKTTTTTTNSSNNTTNNWQVSEDCLKALMDTGRDWDSSFRNTVDNDDDDDGTNKGNAIETPLAEEEKSKEEMNEIISDLMQKFADEEYNNPSPSSEPIDNDMVRLLEEEKFKIRLTPSGNLDRIKLADAASGHEVYWWRDKVARYGDQYTLIWEPDTLLQVGECFQNIVKESAAKGALSSLQFTALSAVFAAVALPVVITTVVANLDNYWSLAVESADEAGQLLADALMGDAHGNRPVVLIGYSVGGRVVASCLSALAKIASGGQDGDEIIDVANYDDNADSSGNAFLTSSARNRQQQQQHTRISASERKRRLRAATIVRDAVIIGAPLDTNTKKWTQRRSVVLGRLINVYNPNDWVLALLYRYKSWSLLVAGLQKVQSKPSTLFSDIENYDVSKIVSGHVDYHSKMQEVLAHIGIGDVDAERFHGDYFVSNQE